MTFMERRPVDAGGLPLPWYTYPAIDVIGSRLIAEMRVFEWGAGYSTLWYAARVREVVACEHNSEWARSLRGKLPGHCTLVEQPNRAEYVSEIARHGGNFDIIVIDGLHRNECAEMALPALGEGGVIIWDNSDLSESEAGLALLVRRGFKRLDLAGMGPINVYAWTTSILYRERNCFGI